MEQDEMGGAYMTNIPDKCIHNCSRKDHLGVVVVDGRIILKWM
jgi:hypothetical protein